jgi:hypothetical protein
MVKAPIPKPPSSAYLVPNDGENLHKINTIKFLLEKISGTSDPKCNAAFMVVLQEINSGRLNG